MKYFTLCALLLAGCVHAALETTATEHHEFDLAGVPSVNVNIMVPVTFEAALSTRIATALKKAEEPSSKYVDSIELGGAITSATLATDTSLAGIYTCQIDLVSDSGAVTLVDHELAESARKATSTDLPLQNATLADVRPLLEQTNPRLRFSLQVRPGELTAKKLITNLAVEVTADLAASL